MRSDAVRDEPVNEVPAATSAWPVAVAGEPPVLQPREIAIPVDVRLMPAADRAPVSSTTIPPAADPMVRSQATEPAAGVTPVIPGPSDASDRSAMPAMFAPSSPIPAEAARSPAVEVAQVPAQPGRMGHEMGVAIARHVATGGGETIAIRLDPADMGRIEVRLSFDDGGTLQAVVAADNPASLDLLRRESPDLVRALADAGVAADAGSFRFDTRSGSGGGQAWQRPSPGPARADHGAAPSPDEAAVVAAYQPLRTRGRVDLMA